jgi:predicted O-methyltransferase YrrM
MPIDESFLTAARKAYNPYTPESGTEFMAPLLYSLVRSARPRNVVEFGSGYTTLFVLRALADNRSDIEDERRLLLEKATLLGELPPTLHQLLRKKAGAVPPAEAKAHIRQLYLKWLGSGGKACMVDPAYYLEDYKPHLYSFEKLPEDHAYVKTMRATVDDIGHSDIFTHIHTEAFSREAVPPSIDLAWNDDHSYRKFFETFWPSLNPKGGIFVFHNVPAVRDWWEDIQWMKKQRAKAGDLEVLILQEPHKIHQNGCAILRRTSEYQPSLEGNLDVLYRSLRLFMKLEDVPPEPQESPSMYRSLKSLVKKKVKGLLARV